MTTTTLTKRLILIERELEELRWALKTPRRGVVASTRGILKGHVPPGAVYTKRVRKVLSGALIKHLDALPR